jgi:hypothetical protein
MSSTSQSDLDVNVEGSDILNDEFEHFLFGSGTQARI